MKVLRDGICYVDLDDIGFKECENLHIEGGSFKRGDMVTLRDKDDIDRIMSLDFIINYDDVCNLSDDGIALAIQKVENDLAYFSDIITATPLEDRQELWADKEFSSAYGANTYKLNTLRNYFQNRDEYDEKVANYILKGRALKKQLHE